MMKGWDNQVFIQGLYFKAVLFKQSINLFEGMEVAESIYEGVAGPYNNNILLWRSTVMFTSER